MPGDGSGVAEIGQAPAAGYRVATGAVAEFGLVEAAASRVAAGRLAARVAGTPGAFLIPPWEGAGVRLPGSSIDRPGERVLASPTEVAAAAIRARLGAAARVAVVCAGGPADLVLLHHATECCRVDGRELLIVVPERTDAAGASGAIQMSTVLAEFAVGADVLVLETDVCRSGVELAWRPAGPPTRHDELALPAALLAARDWGAELLLTATGVDEALRWPPSLPGSGFALGGRRRSVWESLVRRAAAGYPYPARAAIAMAMAATLRLAAEQPWFDAMGRHLPGVAAPLYAEEVLLAACVGGDPGLAGGRTTYQRRHAALGRLVPPAMRAHLPGQEPAPVRLTDHRPVGEEELTACVAAGVTDRHRLPVDPRSPLASRLLAAEAWLKAATALSPSSR